MATARAILVNGREFSADGAAPITIGRDEASDVQLDHDIVSRHHATLTVDDRGWVFRDAGSSNGSFLDQRRVAELVVTSDVRLLLGSVDDGAVLALQLVAPPNAADTRLVAPAPRVATPPAPAPPPAVPLPPAARPVFLPTHRVPASGVATWDSPDPSRPRGPELGPGLEVMVGETKGEWAHITCSNGWGAWVDRRLLVPDAQPAAGVQPRAVAASVFSPLLFAGVALVVGGGFLPWFTGSGVSVNAWDVPLGFVMVDPAETNGPNVGPLLLVVLVALLPLLWRRRPPALLLLLLACAASAPAIGALNRVLTLDDGPSVGIGVIVTFVGCLVLAGEAWRTRSR